MALYMYEIAYTAESWAAQLRNPQNRIETVARPACEAVGGKLVGGWYSFGDYDLVLIIDVPNNESMSAIALAVVAGGAVKAGKTTPLLTGEQGVASFERFQSARCIQLRLRDAQPGNCAHIGQAARSVVDAARHELPRGRFGENGEVRQQLLARGEVVQV